MPELYEGLLTALGAGLLVGLMRERRRSEPDSGPSAAGLRTHTLASLAAALAWHLDPRVYLLLFLVSGALVIVSYKRTAEADVGLTGEFALVVTVLIGALAMNAPALAAALAVVTASLLFLRTQLHQLGRDLISEQEMRDGLLLAASALIVQPMLPTEPIDPWGVVVPASLWKLVVLVMAAGVAGQVAMRIVGARFGLAVAGFFSGFASSTAATASFGARAKSAQGIVPYAASAAIFANLATLALLAAVLATGNAALLYATGVPLVVAGLTLAIAGSAGVTRGHTDAPSAVQSSAQPGAFKLSHALALAAFVAAVLVIAAILNEKVGDRGALAAAAIAGMVELQGAALAIGQLAEGGQIPLERARWGIVLLLGGSAGVKSTLAFVSGGRAYGWRVATALVASVTAAAFAAWAWPK